MYHYLRSSRWLVAEATLLVSEGCRLRGVSEADAIRLAEQVRKGYVFARRGGAGNFYIRRARSFSATTVVELFGPGQCSNVDAAERAVAAENAAIASLVLAGEREAFVQEAIGRPATYVDLLLTSRDSRLAVSSTSLGGREPSGVSVDSKAVKRYDRNGFAGLYQLAVADTELGRRAAAALAWMTASRLEPIQAAALVKIAIAIEALLVSGREPTTRAIGERSAFLLSDDPEERTRINSLTQRFYEARSGIVHGDRRLSEPAIRKALRYGENIAVLVMLVLAAQSPNWDSIGDAQKCCDEIRWGRRHTLRRPWRRSYLRRAINSFAVAGA